MELSLSQKIIQLLLNEGASMKKSELAKILNLELKEILESENEVISLLEKLALRLVRNESSYEVTLSEEVNSLIGKQKIDELRTDLSESALQTISVILYRAKATKAEIDFVRGVDSGRSLKNLLVRGLVEKLEEKNKKYYILSTDTLKFLNIDDTSESPDFIEIAEKLKNLIEG